ncbi:MAG: hypothetical protein JST32_14445 [Bacteroidetes bacterium]|nr:hypothetical protein [Bacteroidota bacterium]
MARSTTIALKKNWRRTWNSSLQRAQIIVGSVLITIISCLLPFFFKLIEKRDGVTLNDWVLNAIPAHDVSWIIFTIIWGMICYGLWLGIQKPTIYINFIWSLIFVMILRVLAISLVPLDPPKNLVVLTDPLTAIFYGRSTITKDLFFSGHTSILFLIFLCLERKADKIIALLATISVACLLLVQHAHYTIDIIVAPIATFGVYLFVRYLLK